MDGDRFDHLARVRGLGPSRRRVIRSLGVLGLGALGIVVGSAHAETVTQERCKRSCPCRKRETKKKCLRRCIRKCK